MGLGPQNSTKKLTQLVDLLGHLLSRNHVSNFSDLGTPLKVRFGEYYVLNYWFIYNLYFVMLTCKIFFITVIL